MLWELPGMIYPTQYEGLKLLNSYFFIFLNLLYMFFRLQVTSHNLTKQFQVTSKRDSTWKCLPSRKVEDLGDGSNIMDSILQLPSNVP